MQKVKYAFSAEKAGHIGTLDPLASGLLPICFGEATKFSRFRNESDKCYRAVLKLGIRTDTGDAFGKFVSTKAVNISRQVVVETLKLFIGNVKQVPPMYSALKYKGKPLYIYARQGIVLDRLPREVTIYSADLRNREENIADIIEIDIHCSKGTYIRSFADDFGEILGCGAHLIALRRISVGDWHVDQAIRLDDLLEIIKRKSNFVEDYLSQNTFDLHVSRDTAWSLKFNDFFSCNKTAWLPIFSLFSDLCVMILDIDQSVRFLLGQRLRVNFDQVVQNFAKFNFSFGELFLKQKVFFCFYQNLLSEDKILAVYNVQGFFLGTANWSAGLLSPLRLVHSSFSKK